VRARADRPSARGRIAAAKAPELPPDTLCNRPPLATLLVLGALASAPAQAGADISVIATEQGTAVQVTARAVVHAPMELIWQTLTDYDHLSEFVPGLVSSRVVSRQGAQQVIEQKGSVRLWIFSYPVRVTVASTERPYEGIDVHLLQGSLRRLDGGYRIEPRPDGSTELTWTGLIEPDDPLPAFIRTPMLRRAISDQFAGMVREIERRANPWLARPAASR
jgi:ribosome-associated toxin RatA of RatAB toxin-antitoxin module